MSQQTITSAARETSIQAAVEAAKQASLNGGTTSEEVRWKGGKLVLQVAQVDLDVVLLNPHSHRIKAQIQSLPTSEQDVITSDPHGTQAQSLLAQLLRDTPGFGHIKNAIQKEGQLDAGVLTTGGILVNANTRAVALRDLRAQYIKVLVLPADAGTKEITKLELQLQMAQDVRQDYAFAPGLLFIEDLVTGGDYTTLEVGRELLPSLTNSKKDDKKAVDHVEKELRLLGLIRDVMTASGGALNIMDFDSQRQALIEVDQDYQRLKSTQPEEAVRVRDAQLAGMISDVDYRRLREIDTTLLDQYIVPALSESRTLGPHIESLFTTNSSDQNASGAPEGLDAFFGDEEEDADHTKKASPDLVRPPRPSLSGLYTLLAQTESDGDVILPDSEGGGISLPRKVVASELLSGLTTAIENKKRDSQQIDELTAPAAHLKEVTRLLDKAATAHADVHALPGFDVTKFDAALQQYRRAAAAFNETISPSEESSD